MRKSLRVGLLVLVALILLATPVLAYAYRATYTITESSSNSYSMLPVSVAADNVWMADNGFMETDALDTRIETLGGLVKPHMVADDRTLTAVPVPADSQTNLYFTTGNTDLASIDIITGNGGYVTMADVAALEPAGDFEIDQKGYLNTSAIGNKHLVYKDGAYATYVSTVSEASSAIGTPVVEVTQVLDDAVVGVFGANWYAQTFTVGGAGIHTAYTTLRLVEVLNPAGDFTVSLRNVVAGLPTGPDLASVSVSASSLAGGPAFYNLYLTAYLTAATQYAIVVSVPAGDAANRIDWYVRTTNPYAGGQRANSGDSGVTWAGVAADDFNFEVFKFPLGITVTGITSGIRRVVTVADAAGAANLTLSVYDDAGGHLGNSPQAVALGGVTVLNTAFDWILAQNIVMPDMEYYKHTVGAPLVAWYQPNDRIHGVEYAAGTSTFTNGSDQLVGAGTAWDDTMIGCAIKYDADNLWVIVGSVEDTTHLTLTVVYAGAGGGAANYTMAPRLPDREGALQDGAITWGTNPAGVATALGGMVSGSQPSPGAPPTDPTPDVMPAIEVTDWFSDHTVGATLLANPLRPLVTIMSDTTTLSEIQAWRIYALAFILLVTVGTAKAVRSHLLLSGIAAGASIGACVALTIFPLWALVFVIGSVLGGMIAERSPSL